MSIPLVQKWYDSIPSIERNQPIIISGGHAYTPSQVLSEVQRGTVLGEALQKVIETRSFTAVIDKYSLAIVRVKARLSKMPADTKLIVGNQSYTPAQLLVEVDQGSKIGRSLIEAEANNVEQVLGKSA